MASHFSFLLFRDFSRRTIPFPFSTSSPISTFSLRRDECEYERQKKQENRDHPPEPVVEKKWASRSQGRPRQWRVQKSEKERGDGATRSIPRDGGKNHNEVGFVRFR